MIANRYLRRATSSPVVRQFAVSCKRRASTFRPSSSSAVCFVVLAAAGITCYTLKPHNLFFQPVYAESASKPEPVENITGRPLKAIKITERTAQINAANLQVKSSWENPGVYAWGLNSGRVAAPDSEERWVKIPRRIPFFDGKLLRDLKLGTTVGVAIDENGDLLQWGNGYAPNTKVPEATLRGRNLRSVVLSEDRVIALGDNGYVYSLPASKEEQEAAPKHKEPGWFWSSTTSIGCRGITPQNLGIGEKVVSIAGGQEHVLMLTSKGRVYSAASSTKDFPRHGQLGIPGLGWYTRPPGPFDQPHEILALKGINIKQIAAGDFHSLALDSKSRVYSFGDNSHGQLGVALNTANMNLNNPLNISPHTADEPVQVPINSLYANSQSTPVVKNIAAGGQNTYFVVESKRDGASTLGSRKLPDISSDAWACGRGIWGTLGVGKWIHVQWGPVKIASLSGMYEYNESTQKPEPIRIGTFKVGQSHVAAIMANITHVAGQGTKAGESHWGSDVYFFGNNENFQLGTGKRNNLASPTHIQPLGIKSGASTEGLETDRFQLTPAKRVTVAGRSVQVEQRVECGRQNSAVYSAAI